MSTTLITVSRARRLVLDHVQRLDSERLAIPASLGRVLAQDVRSRGDVPAFAASAMDGYAVMAGAAGRHLRVVDESRAGYPAQRTLDDGEAIRISTGAAVPAGATAVIPQEDVTGGAGTVTTTAPVDRGQNVRMPGGDMQTGDTVLRAGTRLGAVELGAAATAGAGAITVARRPRVSVLCTGDELRSPGARLGPGQIHNSNAPMLTALAQGAGAVAAPPQRLPDDHEATLAGVSSALQRSDTLIISGGVSVGPHDHVKPVLTALDVREVFWSVALQPGKPTWFGVREDDTLVFGLPGNPVSAVVTFSLFVAPALAARQGATPARRLEAEAELGEDVRRNFQREQAVRVRLERDNGRPTAFLTGSQDSHILTSLLGADALAMIPAGPGSLPAGTAVTLEELAR
jgi:molybdopterin molybdotransferase